MSDAPTFAAPIGASPPRDRAKRLLSGRGRYVDDIQLPRMLHVAFLRSPYAHARIKSIDTARAWPPGVTRIVTGADLVDWLPSFQGGHKMFPELKAPPQHALAVDVARWHGDPVALVVATSRAIAEDAVEAIDVDWEPLEPVTDPHAALEPGAPLIHPELGTNIGFETRIASGDTATALAGADLVVSESFDFGRHAGVSLEGRAIIADYDPAEDSLTVHQSHQTPHQQQDLFARLLGIPDHRVRVICPDVGGAFGIKHHLYADELAVAAAAKLVGRPLKWVADRLEGMLTDVHCRDHRITARMGFRKDGTLVGVEADDIFVVGPYSQYPRSSIGEGNQFARLVGSPYRYDNHDARLRMVYQNKNILGHIRSVGHPLACAVAERLMDKAAVALGQDPIDLRRRNYLKHDDFPYDSPGGIAFEYLSLEACLDKLLGILDLPAARAEQKGLRERAPETGLYRGIGIAGFVELTAIGPEYYGQGGQHISAQETCLLKLEPGGGLRCYTGATDQGQGTDTGLQQIVASVMGAPLEAVTVHSGDSGLSPMGGGSWGSRGAALGGEAALRAARTLRGNALRVAAAVLQKKPEELDIRAGVVVDAATGAEHMGLDEVAAIGHFQPYRMPEGERPDLTVVESYASRGRLFLMGNGIQASVLDVDIETGLVHLRRHIVVHDCGRVINPMLVEEQIRGGVVQGLGGALYEECVYDDQGQMLTGSLVDYLVPMACEMPEIEIGHVSNPTRTSELGAKGAGEAGTAGAIGAVLNAVNDALSPLGASIATTPCTPERILRALGKV